MVFIKIKLLIGGKKNVRNRESGNNLPLRNQTSIGRQEMERYTELLYWDKFIQYIHYDEENDSYYYDPELPERAKKSFEDWLKQQDS